MRQDVFEELSLADNKILKKLDDAKEDHKRILDIFAMRVNLYKECTEKQDDPIVRAIIDAKKSVIMSDMGLLAAQYCIQSDITKITARIDALEHEISRNRRPNSS